MNDFAQSEADKSARLTKTLGSPESRSLTQRIFASLGAFFLAARCGVRRVTNVGSSAALPTILFISCRPDSASSACAYASYRRRSDSPSTSDDLTDRRGAIRVDGGMRLRCVSKMLD